MYSLFTCVIADAVLAERLKNLTDLFLKNKIKLATCWKRVYHQEHVGVQAQSAVNKHCEHAKLSCGARICTKYTVKKIVELVRHSEHGRRPIYQAMEND